MRAGAALVGIPTFASSNGGMMESRSGCAISDVIIADGKRQSVFDSYVRPILGQPNITVVTGVHVRRVVFDGTTATGVEIEFGGERRTIDASERVVLSTGAIRTPQLLMLSGIGPEEELSRLGLPVVQVLPGVGQNLQDHTCFSSIWEGSAGHPPQDNASEAILFASSRQDSATPDMLICQAEVPFPTSYVMDGMPQSGWTMMGGLAKPKSRGTVRLRSTDPADDPICDLNVLSHEDDWRVARAVIELSRDISNSAAFDALRVREVIPGKVQEQAMTDFIRSHAGTFYHYSCTAKMGRDSLSVVDGELNVYGTSRLMVADASVMPTIPTGNIMAPCVAIGERAAEIVLHGL
jgi:choline dehydrogenase